MEKYNYLEAVKADIREYLKENEINLAECDLETLKCQLNDSDDVTGNACGTYTCDRWQAEENLYHNWDLLRDTCLAFDVDMTCLLMDGPEAADVLIRCYLVDQAVDEIIKEETEDDQN